MKLITKYVSCLICTITLYISSCTKFEKLPEVHVAEELMEYFNYQPGTYWVYYDSVNHKTDSFWISENSCCVQHDDGKNNYITPSIYTKSKSGVEVGHGLRASTASFGYQFDKLNDSYAYPTFFFSVPFSSNYMDLVVLGNSYQNILGLTNFDYPDQKDSLFISKEIGVVKMKFPTTNTNYNLLRYKIVKK